MRIGELVPGVKYTTAETPLRHPIPSGQFQKPEVWIGRDCDGLYYCSIWDPSKREQQRAGHRHTLREAVSAAIEEYGGRTGEARTESEDAA